MSNSEEQPIQNNSIPKPNLLLSLQPSHLASPIPQPSRNRVRGGLRGGKSEIIQAPFIWATDRRATVHSYNYLSQNQIFNIIGEVQCKRCERIMPKSFDVRVKFPEIKQFITENMHTMNDRGTVWMNPTLPRCLHCDQEMKPVIADKKRKINWLFLFLGQMLGCCTLAQLKYFCKHTKNHRTGAKDRVLYLTYIQLCKQLDPDGPY